jgi:two-component system NtrC family sensor kinase
LEQVLLNLLVNAGHAMLGGSTISVTTQRQDIETSMITADTGWGISEEHMRRLFEPSLASNPPEPGSQLGLAVARRLVSRQDGHIDIVSQVNEGATAIVTLALAERGDDVCANACPHRR